MRIILVGCSELRQELAARFDLVEPGASGVKGLVLCPSLPEAEAGWDHALSAAVTASAEALRQFAEAGGAGRAAVCVIEEQRLDRGASVLAAVCAAACLRLVSASARELAAAGIRVNAVLLGVNGGGPLGRAPSAPEVAATISFLLSPASSYSTGSVLRLDAGAGAGVTGYLQG